MCEGVSRHGHRSRYLIVIGYVNISGHAEIANLDRHVFPHKAVSRSQIAVDQVPFSQVL